MSTTLTRLLFRLRLSSRPTFQVTRYLASRMESDLVAVCKLSDLQVDRPKEVDVNGTQVILAKNKDGQVFAVGSKCPHYDLPLSKGVIHNGTIRCSFHGACFNLKTGDIEDLPGYGRIPSYNVQIEDEDVKVCPIPIHRKLSVMEPREPMDARLPSSRAVVIGGGIAAYEFVHTLRSNGFSGSITILTEDSNLPYDRPKVTKIMTSKAEDIVVKPKSFYDELEIEVMTDSKVVQVDTSSKSVTTENGLKYCYDKLFIATGLRSRKTTVPGSDMKNIFYIRNIEHANQVVEASRDKEVVIIGSSFIAMEAASFLKFTGKKVTVIGRSAAPFSNILGDVVGRSIQSAFEARGVEFIMMDEPDHFEGDDAVKTVHLKSGKIVPADVVVVGLGGVTDTSFLAKSGIMLDDNGYIIVDQFMKTNVEDVFAGGDVASFVLNDLRQTTGHWTMAQSQGKCAAENLLETHKPFNIVPYFWSLFFIALYPNAIPLRFSGHIHQSQPDPFIDGDVDKQQFVAYYFHEGKVTAVATVGVEKEPALFMSLTKSGQVLTEEEVRSNPKKWFTDNIHQE